MNGCRVLTPENVVNNDDPPSLRTAGRGVGVAPHLHSKARDADFCHAIALSKKKPDLRSGSTSRTTRCVLCAPFNPGLRGTIADLRKLGLYFMPSKLAQST